MNSQVSLLNRSKGYTVMELLIVLVAIGILVSIAAPKFARGNDAKNVQILLNDISEINTQAKSFKGTAPTYAGVSITAMTANSQLDSDWGTGAGANPLGGNYTAAASGSNLVVTATGLTTGVCDLLRRRMNSTDTPATCAGSTFTITYR